MNIKDLIKDNTVAFHHYRNGNMFYWLYTREDIYEFPVPLEDIGNATLEANDKAITFMRYIRKAIEGNTIQKVFVTTSATYFGEPYGESKITYEKI